MCERVKRDPETEGGSGSCLGCRVDGWDLQDGSGIKGHSFLTGVCGVRGLARADNNLNELLSFSPTSQREPRLDAARLGGHQAKKTRVGKL